MHRSSVGAVRASATKRESEAWFDHLNGIRGFFALLVLFAHYPQTGNLEAFGFLGFPSVYGFFVLSSFLLTYRFLVELEGVEHGLSARGVRAISVLALKYAIRRVMRIYPMYVVTVLLIWHGPAIYGEIFPSSNGMQLKLADVILLRYVYRSVFWTLPNEFRYYILIPFIALGFSARRRRVQAAALVAVFATILYLDKYHPRAPFISCQYCPETWPSYIPQFLAGSVAAFVYYRIKQTKFSFGPPEKHFIGRFFRTLLALGTDLLIAAYALLIRSNYASPHQWKSLTSRLAPYHYLATENAIAYGFSFLIVLSASTKQRSIIAALFSSAFWQHMGKVSYSIYLTHLAYIRLCRERLPDVVHSVEGLMLCVLISMAASTISYYLVEMPGMRLGALLCRLIDAYFEPTKTSRVIAKKPQQLAMCERAFR